MIKWTATKAETEIINRIANRAVKLAKEIGFDYPKQDALMDLKACHCNGNPLDLRRFEQADDSNFGHDVFGIYRHIDRSTGQLKDCFSPRFSLPESKAQGGAK